MAEARKIDKVRTMGGLKRTGKTRIVGEAKRIDKVRTMGGVKRIDKIQGTDKNWKDLHESQT